ncbi:MAG TPA: NifU family protein [Bacteroidales bacterium]|nr:NifU family protein [Bacteroidales bacterium]
MEELKKKIEKSIEEIRPYLKADGGDISLVEITDDMVVKVKLLGACGSCPFSIQTLKLGVEAKLIQDVPEVKEVVSV